MSRTHLRAVWVMAVLVTLAAIPALASSHREAPGILKRPMVDGTDFYMFRSYEAGREGFVTLIANFNPLQDPYGGPNYFPLDPEAQYIFNIDHNGDCKQDLQLVFDFEQTSPFIALDVGDAGATRNVPIPLSNAGQITADDDATLNVDRTYRVTTLRGPGNRNRGTVRDANTQSSIFRMPFDNIGNKSMPDYETYARQFVHDIDIPGCSQSGRMFVGQRKESFAVNLGEVFDLVNVSNPLGDPAAEESDTADKNVTTLALELPIACVTGEGGSDAARDVESISKTHLATVAGWATARLPNATQIDRKPEYNAVDRRLTRGVTAQVSRLGHPLVNEVVIGLPDKDRFNGSSPVDDGQFLEYVSHPTLPELIEILFGSAGVVAPNLFPRQDLIAVFLTGVEGLNQDGGVCEVLRLNYTIDPKSAAEQANLGVLAGDLAGFPNGRRPGDDTVDIALRAMMGVLLPEDVAPSGQLPFTDGAEQNALQFDETFPYLTTPIPGSPNETP